MGCTFCAWWRRWFPATEAPPHHCFYDEICKEEE
jgi:hypothetical protein